MLNNKSKITKAVAAITLFVIISGLIFSRTGENRRNSLHNPEPESSAEDVEIAQRKEEGKRFLESFLVAYNSYRIGDTSNIENLYSFMEAEMLIQEKEKVARLKKNYKEYEEFRSVEAEIQSTSIESYEQEILILQTTIKKTALNGAFVPDPEGDENDGFILLDRNGTVYSGGIEDLKEKEEMETYRITGSDGSGSWKVSEVQKIN